MKEKTEGQKVSFGDIRKECLENRKREKKRSDRQTLGLESKVKAFGKRTKV